MSMDWLFGGDDYSPLYSYEEIEAMFDKYLGHYMEAGEKALYSLEDQYLMLLNNPAAIQEMLGSGFEESPGYQYQYDQAMNASNQSAGAGGMLGTPAHAAQSMGTAQGLAAQDYNNYINRNQQLYNTGINTAQGINQMGYNASSTAASGMGNYMGSTMAADYKKQASQMDSLSSLIGAGLGGFSSIFM